MIYDPKTWYKREPLILVDVMSDGAKEIANYIASECDPLEDLLEVCDGNGNLIAFAIGHQAADIIVGSCRSKGDLVDTLNKIVRDCALFESQDPVSLLGHIAGRALSALSGKPKQIQPKTRLIQALQHIAHRCGSAIPDVSEIAEKAIKAAMDSDIEMCPNCKHYHLFGSSCGEVIDADGRTCLCVFGSEDNHE
jgi:hypothetical protein